MKILPIIILSVALSACGTTPTAIIPPPDKTVRLDPRVYESCKPLVKLPKDATFEDLFRITIDNYMLYYECAKKQDLSIKLLKDFSNYKEPK